MKTDLNEKPLPISQIKYSGKNPYVEYLGEPYLMYGVQMRIDWIYIDVKGDIEFIEENFKRAKADGFNSVMIPIYWRVIEPDKDVYDFSRLKLYYEFLSKYDLTVQWLWFGTDVCGMGYNIPDYICNNNEEYRRIALKDNPAYFFDFSCAASMEREQRALAAMMQWIAENDTEKRCVMIQLDNEVDQGADMFQENVTEGVVYDKWWITEEAHDKYCWVGGQREAVFEQLSKLGDIVHSSNYPVVTRVNVSGAARDAVPELVKDFHDMLAKSGIDMVGVDSYYKTWECLSAGVNIVEGNITHVAENGGYYDSSYNTVGLFGIGAGMLIYCHRDDREHFGLYEKNQDKEWIELESTSDVREFNKMLNKAEKLIASAVAEKSFTSFNCEHKDGPLEIQKTCGGETILFTCDSDGLGAAFPINEKSFILMATKDNSVFNFTDCTNVLNAEVGYYNGYEWTLQNKAEVSGNKIILGAYQTVKVNLE